MRLRQYVPDAFDAAEIHTDICNLCHPFFTGKQKLIDTAGRVERFRQKYGDRAES